MGKKSIIQKKNITLINIRIVEKKEIQKLNYLYKKNNKATNILSFSYNQIIKKNYILLGDLVLCKEIIEKEAIKYKKTIESRWAHMIIHGTLHLMGYDHNNKKNTNNMEQIENETMLFFNYEKPYILNDVRS